MANEVRIEARPWEPQDLIDDLQLMIDEEPDSYLNGNRTTLCMARDYLKKFFSEESLRPKGRREHPNGYAVTNGFVCSECGQEEISYRAINPRPGGACLADENGNFYYPPKMNYCPNCGAKMMEG